MKQPFWALLASASTLTFLLPPPAVALPVPSPSEVAATPTSSTQPAAAPQTPTLEQPASQPASEAPQTQPATEETTQPVAQQSSAPEPTVTQEQRAQAASVAAAEVQVAAVFTARYAADGGPNRAIYGKPASRAVTTNGVTVQDFERGTLVYSPNYGTFLLYGAIRGQWKANGGLDGWGMPTSDEIAIGPGKVAQNFVDFRGRQNTAYWSERTGTHATNNTGAIGGHYQINGGYRSWGLPTSDERCGYAYNSCYQDFEYGTFTWAPVSSGTHILHGAILTRWRDSGGMNSPWGIPTSDEMTVSDGDVQQNLLSPSDKHGALYWTNHRGNTNYVNFDSGMGAYWVKEGGYQARGVNTPYRYGFPVSEESCNSGGWCVQRYEYGQITWKNGIWVQDLADMLRAYTAPDGTKLKVVETNGWKVRGYEGKGFESTSGVLWHHTATPESYFKNLNMPTLSMLMYGRPDLDGPLTQLGMGRDGSIYVVAAGYGSHAGRGRVGNIVNRGNYHLLGIEMESSGIRDDWTAAQRNTMPYVGAALELAYGETAPFYQIAHREYTSEDKIGPAYIGMNKLRSDIQKDKGR